jgi:hypothetical protein
MWTLFLTLKQTKDFLMITVQKPISPKVTELQALIARLEMRGNGKAKTVRELRAKKLAGQRNINDRESRIAMVMAEQEFPATDDTDAKLTSELLEWEAIEEAKQSLKPKLDAAKREASDKVLVTVKSDHDAVMKKLVSGLSVATEAWIELFQLSRDLLDYDIGYRNGICETMPLDLFGPPNAYSPLAEFMGDALKAGHLKSLPRAFVLS